MKLAIVGAFEGAHIGGSLLRAAQSLGVEVVCFDTIKGSLGSRVLASLRWRLDDRRPLRMRQFSSAVLKACAEARPDVLIATGSAGLSASTVQSLKSLGAVCINISTDDPWNPAVRARWYLRALPQYDAIFTTRRANVEDLTALGCRDVRYLPFGYDDALFRPHSVDDTTPCHDVLFVGGADRDRVDFMSQFMASGPAVTLVGAYWDQFIATRAYSLGSKAPDAISALTTAAKVNLCLVRRANRDGHVMRSFEIAAIGGCMLVEDTAEHREIFGPDGDCVVYFTDPAHAGERARVLIADPAARRRLASAVRARIGGGGHTYEDRLAFMLDVAAERLDQRGWVRAV